ncbi:MAG TPA: M56 family metallopeptidase, partial [Candidatus Hydrogenedentes bacterium]|nr:M56 family metallopeptidase [Candidatus Hydrogenedentota bacterium]
RLLLGCAYVSFLRSTAITQREGPLADLVAEADGPLRMRRRVRIATTRVAHGPVLAGIFRSVILLPEYMAEALTPKQMKLVITHELAHAKRWDNLVLLIQRLAEMFFFFHPVVWFCGWMMRREAEAACDDMVVSAYGDADGAGAAAYADSLTRVAEMKCGITRRLLVNTFAAAESNFHRRIKRILSGRSGRMTLWLSLATGAALVLIGVLGLPTVTSAPSSDEEVNNLEKLLDQPGSIAFENQHVSEILEFISDSTDTINFAIDWRVVQLPPHVSSKANTRACGRIPVYVTDGMVPFIDVHNVLWREVLDTLLLPLGLTYVVKEHYVWISSLEMHQEDAADSISPPRNSDPGLMKALSDISNIEFEDISVREILDFISMLLISDSAFIR